MSTDQCNPPAACPKCGGSDRVAKGFTRGRQRYRCRLCGYTYSTTGIPKRLASVVSPVPCPTCAHNTAKPIETSSKKPRFKCDRCGTRYTRPTRSAVRHLPEALRPECKRCGSRRTVRCGARQGKQQMRCKDCDHQFLIIVKFLPVCPKCDGTHIIKKGHIKGKQRFACKRCSHHYTKLKEKT